MSLVYRDGEWWIRAKDGTETRAPAVQGASQANDMPQGLQQKVARRSIPRGWIMAVYSIPQTQTPLRRELCYLLKSHGLQTMDSRAMINRGGSAYIGPENPKMDKGLRDLVTKLKERTGASDLVKIYAPNFSELEASDLLDTVTKNALQDLKDAEDSLTQLNEALVGNIVIKNADDQPVDLVTTGYGRIVSARRAISEADSVVVRFNGGKELEAEGNRIRTRLQQISAWTDKVEEGYKRYCEKHPRVRKTKTQEGGA